MRRHRTFAGAAAPAAAGAAGLVLAAGLLLPGAAALAGTLPDQAARYAVSVRSADEGAEGHDAPMRFWNVRRNGDRVEIQADGVGIGQVWDTLPGGDVAKIELYHGYRTALHYTPGDGRAMQARADWQLQAGLFNGHLVPTLERVPSPDARYLDHEASLYRGQVGSSTLEVTWLPGPALPALVRLTDDDREETARLIEFHPLGQSPLPYIEWDGIYEDLDFADLGDSETHPLARDLHRLSTDTMYPAHSH